MARRRFRPLPVNSLAPNILTVLALCAGLTSMRYALQERWEEAVIAILVAAVLDGLDGRLARLLKGATKFGAELDSLSDFVSFGVAPVFLLYLWSLHSIGGIGWIVVLAYTVCCALRLARFNTALDVPDKPSWQNNFFTGIPSPAGAGLVLLFVFVSFEAGDTFWRSSALNWAWVLLIAFLMVSRVPSFSFKKVRVRRDFVLPLLLLVAVLAAVLVTFPWYFLIGVMLAYLVSLPLAWRAWQRLDRDHKRQVAPEDTEDDEAVEAAEAGGGPPAAGGV